MDSTLPLTNYKNQELKPLTSRFSELPLLSLGYHTLLGKARDKLYSISELAGVHDIIQKIQPYYFEEEADSIFLELRETLAEYKACTKGVKNCLVITQDAKITRAFKGYLPSSGVKTTDKHTKLRKSDLLVITGIQDNPTALTLGCHGDNKNVVVRLYEYPLFSTSFRLLAVLTSCFEEVKLYRPKVTSPFQVNGIVYVIGIKRKQTCDLENIIKVFSPKTNIVDIVTDYEPNQAFKEALQKANIEFVSSNILAIESMYKFIRAKDYYGTTMNKYKEEQERQSKEWRKKYM
jgi:hypothetical protein